MKLEDKVTRLISEHLGWNIRNVTPEKSLEHDLGADSLDTIELVMALEEDFKIPEISDEQMREWKTVQDVIEGVRNLSLDDETE